MLRCTNGDLAKLLKENNITKLYAYSRKSRDIDGEGLQKHHDILQQFADEHGLPLEVLEEVGSSEILNRPMLNDVRVKIKAKEIRCLLIYRMDRLTRKTTDLERLLDEFSYYELILIEVHNNRLVDYNNKMGIKMEGVVADLYQDHAKQVLNAGKKNAISLYGNHLGEAPLGYTYNRVTKKLEPNEDAKMIKDIYQLYLDGMNLFDVAIEMNKRGHKTRNGNIFTHKTIRDTLTNEKYIGIQVYGKRKWHKDPESGKKTSKEVPESEWIVYENAHEPIITLDELQRVKQKLIDNRTVDVNSRKRTYGLTNILKCGICGRTITFYVDSISRKTYMKPCANMDFTTGKRCPNGASSLSVIDQYIDDKMWYEIRKAILHVNWLIAEDRASKALNNSKGKLDDLNKQKKEVNKQLDNLLDLQIARGVDQRLIDKENQLKYRLKQIEDEIDSIDVEEDELLDVQMYMDLSQDFHRMPLSYKSKDNELRNKTLKKYIDKIVYTKNNLEPEKPKLEIHYTEKVEQAMRIYKQYKEEQAVRLEARRKLASQGKYKYE